MVHDHLLRSIDRFVDLGGIHVHLADFYSHTWRPSVDPESLIPMLLVGYCFGIRSARRLCEDVHLNLAYRWLSRLDLNDRVPDHSTAQDHFGQIYFELAEACIDALEQNDEAKLSKVLPMFTTLAFLAAVL